MIRLQFYISFQSKYDLEILTRLNFYFNHVT